MKPFPPPPHKTNRDKANELPKDSQSNPFGNPTHPPFDDDPRLSDPEVIGYFERYLRHDQRKPVIYKFILSYLVNRNATQAARDAGLSSSQGHYWRTRPEIHACIEALTAAAVLKHGYDANEVIERAKEIATLDPIEFQNPDGSFKTHMSEIRPEARRAIKKFKAKNLFSEDVNGVKVVIGQLIEVELWDKLKGIELLGREKQLFKQTTVMQHDVTENMKDVLLESNNRAEERLRLLNAREVGNEQIGQGQSSDRDQGWGGDGVPVGEQGGKSPSDGSGVD